MSIPDIHHNLCSSHSLVKDSITQNTYWSKLSRMSLKLKLNPMFLHKIPFIDVFPVDPFKATPLLTSEWFLFLTRSSNATWASHKYDCISVKLLGLKTSADQRKQIETSNSAECSLETNSLNTSFVQKWCFGCVQSSSGPSPRWASRMKGKIQADLSFLLFLLSDLSFRNKGINSGWFVGEHLA